ncbi:proline iminopeptidase-family hydrolase [Sphingomonas sp. NPDC079357]|uniref:proline iminopeptidase-family hydrolase n=1 Tax=Sphingomonas sp. NPDC079357 TaxID=3364518 RepID=UPI0038518167
MRLSRRALLAGGAAALAPLPATARDAVYPPPAREAMLAVPGGRVYVRVNGDLNGPRPPLVLIHGGPGGTHTGMLDALALADERAVILYDQLDSGRSDWPQDPANWRVSRFVDELEAIRRGLAVSLWHVCGISWGGTIALEYAARRPAELVSTVLGGPLIATRAWLADADALRSTLPRDARDTLLACEGMSPPSPTTCDAATDVFYRHYNRREDASPALRAAAHAAGNRGSNQQLYETMWGKSEFVSTGTLRDYDGTPLLRKLDGARTLFMVGQYDEARPVTALGFAAQVPGGAEVAVIPGAAHGTLSDRPRETVGILRGWLARHDTRAL